MPEDGGYLSTLTKWKRGTEKPIPRKGTQEFTHREELETKNLKERLRKAESNSDT